MKYHEIVSGERPMAGRKGVLGTAPGEISTDRISICYAHARPVRALSYCARGA
jgi:hypothetical protein